MKMALVRWDPLKMSWRCRGAALVAVYGPIATEIVNKSTEFVADPNSVAIDLLPDFFVGVPIERPFEPECIQDILECIQNDDEDDGWQLVKSQTTAASV